jgi:hypothetical protein
MMFAGLERNANMDVCEFRQSITAKMKLLHCIYNDAPYFNETERKNLNELLGLLCEELVLSAFEPAPLERSLVGRYTRLVQ